MGTSHGRSVAAASKPILPCRITREEPILQGRMGSSLVILQGRMDSSLVILQGSARAGLGAARQMPLGGQGRLRRQLGCDRAPRQVRGVLRGLAQCARPRKHTDPAAPRTQSVEA